MNELTAERVRELFHYDPDVGIFTRLKRTSKNTKIGESVGCIRPDGYLSVSIDNKAYQLHRIAWLYVTGEFPKHQIDHVNGARDDNRLTNLREATNAQNSQNRGRNKNNSSGYTGVTWNTEHGKWKPQISWNGKVHHLGYFDDPEEAHKMYLFAKENTHHFQGEPRD